MKRGKFELRTSIRVFPKTYFVVHEVCAVKDWFKTCIFYILDVFGSLFCTFLIKNIHFCLLVSQASTEEEQRQEKEETNVSKTYTRLAVKTRFCMC